MSCLQRKIKCNGKYQELVHNLRPLLEQSMSYHKQKPQIGESIPGSRRK